MAIGSPVSNGTKCGKLKPVNNRLSLNASLDNDYQGMEILIDYDNYFHYHSQWRSIGIPFPLEISDLMNNLDLMDKTQSEDNDQLDGKEHPRLLEDPEKPAHKA
ncbi:hypothetical protein Tcan_15294 [Toxocara canis]|uniref:Uncharacterized protein n=1 Tax=Toxocara canis TaxID=6265 RepID=A0A0B2VMF0_TOXCA|nr:hypothetical protein Tcan_15294 [Toxocara canis]